MKVIRAEHKLEGGGFEVNRPFPTMALSQVDPFLLLDQMGPKQVEPGQGVGAPDHPHRGFETVTYMLSGEMEHRDSHGNHGVIGPGDVQWMTAGQGVIHSEMPTAAFQKSGGLSHGVQLWVNLPAKDKLMEPRYQDIPRNRIPEVDLQPGTVRVLAGEYRGTQAIIDTRTPIEYLHFQLPGGVAADHTLVAGHNGFLYVLKGAIQVGDTTVPTSHLAMLDPGATSFVAKADAEVLWLSGVPINEPIARWGPFVMNTRDEIQQAMYDYQTGRFGKIPGKMAHGRPTVLVLDEVYKEALLGHDVDVIVAADPEEELRKRPDFLLLDPEAPTRWQAMAASVGVTVKTATLETIGDVTF